MNSVTSGHVFLLIVFHSSQKAVIGKSSTSHIPKLSQNKKPTIREMFKIHTKVDEALYSTHRILSKGN